MQFSSWSIAFRNLINQCRRLCAKGTYRCYKSISAAGGESFRRARSYLWSTPNLITWRDVSVKLGPSLRMERTLPETTLRHIVLTKHRTRTGQIRAKLVTSKGNTQGRTGRPRRRANAGFLRATSAVTKQRPPKEQLSESPPSQWTVIR